VIWRGLSVKIVTPNQMAQIDNKTINTAKIPGIVLMENAAVKVFYESLNFLNCIEDKSITIFAGKGNNGGDALAVARMLYNNGAKVKVYLFSDNYKNDAKINFDIVKEMKLDMEFINSNINIIDLRLVLNKSDLIIDGIFGTGLNGTVKGDYLEVINIINEAEKDVIAIDIPSGINGLTGEVLGTCIKAASTVCFGLPKIGMYKNPGKQYLGNLKIVDISIPQFIINSFEIKSNLITKKYIKSIFQKRYDESNKGTYGKVFLVTGSKGMTGAGILSAEASYRSGSGLVYLGVPKSLVHVYGAMIAESVCKPLDDNNGYFNKNSYKEIIEFSKSVDVLGIGPGISNRDDLTDFLENIIGNVKKPIVLDADALNIISKKIEILDKAKGEIIITPHPGEMARLTGKSISEIQSNRIKIAKDYSFKWNVIIVLKGNNTIIALPNGEIFINDTGNNGMATAGSGDVLTGIIISIIGQGKTPKEAALIGTYLHGLAGDYASKELTKYSVMAKDIINNIPNAIKEIINI
jgi:NAD(P)H-hydrate epimerase